jgi:hypothetical protein
MLLPLWPTISPKIFSIYESWAVDKTFAQLAAIKVSVARVIYNLDLNTKQNRAFAVAKP